MRDFLTYLYEVVNEPLPGFDAQARMMPESSHQVNHSNTNCEGCIQSAVLMLLHKQDNHYRILITERSHSLNSHKGQLSFPGGKCDGGESPEETALRETFEEVGLPNTSISLIGRLSGLYMKHRDTYVQPVVSYLSLTHPLNPNPSEVADCFWVTLDELSNPEKCKTKIMTHNNINWTVPYWDIHSTPLWGATAMMLSELIYLYNTYLKTESFS